jgi:hypothetical protein
LLIKLTSSVMQGAEGMYIRLKDVMLTHYLRLETIVKVTFKESILIGSLSCKAVHKNNGTVVLPELSWQLDIAPLEHGLSIPFVN